MGAGACSEIALIYSPASAASNATIDASSRFILARKAWKSGWAMRAGPWPWVDAGHDVTNERTIFLRDVESDVLCRTFAERCRQLAQSPARLERRLAGKQQVTRRPSPFAPTHAPQHAPDRR